MVLKGSKGFKSGCGNGNCVKHPLDGAGWQEPCVCTGSSCAATLSSTETSQPHFDEGHSFYTPFTFILHSFYTHFTLILHSFYSPPAHECSCSVLVTLKTHQDIPVLKLPH